MIIVTSSTVNLITYIQLWLLRHKDYKQTYVHVRERERDDINNYKLSFTHIFHILYAKHEGRRTRKLICGACWSLKILMPCLWCYAMRMIFAFIPLPFSPWQRRSKWMTSFCFRRKALRLPRANDETYEEDENISFQPQYVHFRLSFLLMNSLSSHGNEMCFTSHRCRRCRIHRTTSSTSCMEIPSSLMFINVILLFLLFSLLILLWMFYCSFLSHFLSFSWSICRAKSVIIIFMFHTHVKYTMKHKVKLFNNESDISPSEKFCYLFSSLLFTWVASFLNHLKARVLPFKPKIVTHMRQGCISKEFKSVKLARN